MIKGFEIISICRMLMLNFILSEWYPITDFQISEDGTIVDKNLYKRQQIVIEKIRKAAEAERLKMQRDLEYEIGRRIKSGLGSQIEEAMKLNSVSFY
jgi:hypothetical protein